MMGVRRRGPIGNTSGIYVPVSFLSTNDGSAGAHKLETTTAHLELAHRHGLLQPNLNHIQHLAIKAPHPDQPVRPLLAVHPDDKQARVVLVAEEFERLQAACGVDVEWVDRVLLVKVDRVREFEGVLWGRELISWASVI
jgi:hypothetical protein